MSWDYLLVQATNGAVIGVIYALIAVGVTLIFSILKIVNFAHGDLYMLGGYCAYFVIEGLGFPPLAAMGVAMAALFAGAIVLERLMLTPLYSDATERKDEYGLIVTFGLAYFLRNTAVIAFGPFPLKPPSFIPGIQRIGNVIVTNDRLVGGSIIAGLVLGEAENLFTAFFPDPTRAFAYTNAFGVLVLMVVLIVRPQGLFGRRHLRME